MLAGELLRLGGYGIASEHFARRRCVDEKQHGSFKTELSMLSRHEDKSEAAKQAEGGCTESNERGAEATGARE
jgi:hypothetical protein